MSQEKYQQHAYKNAEFIFLGGSNAYGTQQEGSDEDMRGVFFAPPYMLTNPFIDFRTDVVKHTEHEDMILWEMGSYMSGLTTAPDKMDALFVPKDCWVKSPGPAMRLLMAHRDEFLTQKMAKALLGHARRDLAILKKGVKPTKDALIEPRQLDYLYIDAEKSEKLRLDAFAEAGAETGLYIEKARPEGEMIRLNLYKHPTRGNTGPASQHLTPVRKGTVPDSSHFLCSMYYDRRAYDDANRTYKNRMNAPERSSAKATLAEIHGFDTKTAANALRCARLAHELSLDGTYQVRRPDAQELLDIRNHASRSLDSIMKETKELNDSALDLMLKGPLPDDVDYEKMSELYKNLYSAREHEKKKQFAVTPSP